MHKSHRVTKEVITSGQRFACKKIWITLFWFLKVLLSNSFGKE